METAKKVFKRIIDIFYFSLLIISILLYFLEKQMLFLYSGKLLIIFRGFFITGSIFQIIKTLFKNDNKDSLLIWKLVYKAACLICLIITYHLVDSAIRWS